ncbi:MAG: class GN sortase [Nitrospinota bacterium]|nr:class GN sortase [Nitrospinota bacterium]
MAFLIGVAGLTLALSGGYIHAKAAVAQMLIERAWRLAANAGEAPKPWPWADTRPVAVLEAPRLGKRLVALEGDSGRTLAFGPGHASGSAMPGAPGVAIFSGHRDTHFSFLRWLHKGDILLARTSPGEVIVYRVVSMEVADSQTASIVDEGDEAMLALVTCWPFDAVIPGGPMRYVVMAAVVGRMPDNVHLEPNGQTKL